MEIIAKQDKAIQVAIVKGGPTVEGLREIARDPPQITQKRRTAGVQVAAAPRAAFREHGDEGGEQDRARAGDLQA